MAYVVDCQCGKPLPVTAAQAGSQLSCECGREVDVPRLSQLRESAGEGAYESSSVDVVRRMIREGALPAASHCQKCGVVTDGAAYFTVVCERPWLKSNQKADWRWLLLFISWPVWLLSHIVSPKKRDEPGADVRGREVTIDIPLRMCPACAENVTRRELSAHALKELLREHPATERLLHDYADAEVFPSTSR